MKWKMYPVRALTDEQAERIAADIPGAWVRGRSHVEAHDNAAWMVEAWMRDNCSGVSYVRSMSDSKYRCAHVYAPELRTTERLFPYQRRVIETGANMSGLIVHAPAGSGKSYVAICLALQQPGPIIWITKAVTRLGHSREVKSYTTCHAQIIEGFGPFEVDPNARFYIFGWETISHHWPAIVAMKPATVVYDEVQKAAASARSSCIPNPDGTKVFVSKNNISSSAAEISKACTRRIGATATLVGDRVKGIWSPLDLVQPYQYGTRARFMTRYAGRHINQFGGTDDNGATNIAELKKRLQFTLVKVTKAESHASLPPMRHEVLRIPASELITVGQRIQARQVQGLGPLEAALALSSVRKRKVIKELTLESLESGQKVSIFVGRQAEAQEVADMIDKATNNAPVVCVHGGMTTKAKDESAQAYMRAEGPACLVATGYSMGEGFDGLQCTQLALMAFLPWTPRHVIQWTHRFARIGQQTQVLIKYLVAEGGADEQIAITLLDKLPPIEQLFDDRTMSDLKGTLLGSKTDEQWEKELMEQIGLSS
jgi:superfamily II DNA or RNA helicase